MTRPQLNEATVVHLLDSAERARKHGMAIAVDRYLERVREILNTRRVPKAEEYKARLDRLSTTTV